VSPIRPRTPRETVSPKTIAETRRHDGSSSTSYALFRPDRIAQVPFHGSPSRTDACQYGSRTEDRSYV
jgi:hypothetical protein